MKILIFLSLLLLFAPSAEAAKVEYFTWLNPQSEYVNLTKVSCGESEGKLCHYMCGNEKWCAREEGKCTNCAGTNDLFLRILFTRLQTNFEVTEETWDTPNMVAFLADTYYQIVSYKSVYNFHKKWGSEEVKNDFQSFCPNEAVDPLLILNMNEKNQPQDVVGVICSDERGQSYVRVVRSKNENRSDDINQQTP